MINTVKIKARMIEKGMNIQILAPKIPCTPYTLGRQISNKKPMKLETAEKLSEELDITDTEFPEFFLQKELQKCNEN